MHGSNPRASLAAGLGLFAALALPVAILLARETAGVSLLDAFWAVPLAAACGVGALLAARGAKTVIRVTLERSGGAGRTRAAVILAVAGICFAVSGAIAVGFYELLLRLEG